jgi:hypothetical protein
MVKAGNRTVNLSYSREMSRASLWALACLGTACAVSGCAVLDSLSGDDSLDGPGGSGTVPCENGKTCFNQLPSVAIEGTVVAMAAGHTVGENPKFDDIVMVTEDPHQVLVARQGGPGFEIPFKDVLFGRPLAVVLGNLDQASIPEAQGRLDIAIIMEEMSSVCLFHSHPYLHQTDLPGCPGKWRLEEQPVALAVGDLDGGDPQELVVASATRVYVYRVRGDFEALDLLTSYPVPGTARLVGVGNFDASGRKDDIAVVTSDGGMYVWFNLPPPMMGPAQVLAQGSPSLALTIADFDGDSSDDFALLTDCGCEQPVRLFMNARGTDPSGFMGQPTIGTQGAPRYLTTGRVRTGPSVGLALSNSRGLGSGPPSDVEIWHGMDSGVPNDFYMGVAAGGPVAPLVAGRFASGSVDDLAVIVRMNGTDQLNVFLSKE